MGGSRIADVHLPELPLECAVSDPGSRRFCAVRDEERPRIVQASRAARARGVRPGMTEAEARARLPELTLLLRHKETERRRLHSLAEALLSFGPMVELAPPVSLFVEVGRSRGALEKRLGSSPTDDAIAEEIVRVMKKNGHSAVVAIAKDPDVARTLALHLSRVSQKKGVRAPRTIVAPPG